MKKHVKKHVIFLVLACTMILTLSGSVSAADNDTNQTVISASNNVNLTVANDNGVRFNDYPTGTNQNNTYNYFNPTQSASQGLNALHITTNTSNSAGSVVFTNQTSGTFYLSDTGGRGWDDNGILMLAVNGTISDNFQITIIASGYQWTPVPTGSYPTFSAITYYPVALNETFYKSDFIYGPETWRPCAGTNNYYPIFDGQNMTDTNNTFRLMFIDLYAGILGSGTLGQSSFAGQTIYDNGMIKVQYFITGLSPGQLAAFDDYAYTVSSNQGQGIRWTNRLSASGSSGYAVNGVVTTPVANFTATPTNGTAPLTVQFKDTSSNSPTIWAWDFDNDGTIDSTLQNPTWIYNNEGNYTVTLTAANTAGNSTLTKTDYIAAYSAPVANFSANSTSGSAPLTVQFTDQSTGSGPLNYAWDFNNDGTDESTEQDPSYTYNNAGIYAVKLTVTGPGGSDTTTKINYINVTNLLPNNRHIFINVANDEGVKFNLDGTAYGGPNDTYYIKADATGLGSLHISTNYINQLGQVTVINSTNTDSSGVFYLTDTGGKGFNDDVILLLSVKGPIPDNFTVRIRSSGYGNWTLATPGNYTPSLPTSYQYMDGAIDQIFTKSDFQYGPQLYKPGPGTLGTWSLPLYYGENTSDPSNAEYLMFIDLYRGILRNSSLINGGFPKVEYWFTSLNTTASFNMYTWVAASNQGEGISYTQPTSGTNATGYTVNYVIAPVANFTANSTSGTAPLNVEFTDQSTNGPTSWSWDFNNDDVIDSTSQNPSWNYSIPGTYTVTLTAGNIAGNSTLTKTNCINVNWPVPVANFTTNVTTGLDPLSVQFTDTSTGNVTCWAWDFNNDGVLDSTEKNPIWTYSVLGNYTVILTVTGPGGSNNITKTNYITVFNSTPPTVTANPEEGLYNATQTVTLNSNQAGSTIYYTTDDSDPTDSANSNRVPYSSPIPISSTTNLQYAAMNAGGVWSTRYNKTYVIDTSTPTVTASPEGGWYNTTQTVTLNTTDADTATTTYYTTDNTDPQNSLTRVTYTVPITVSTTTTLKYIAIDLASNWSPLYTQNYIIPTLITAYNHVYINVSNENGVMYNLDGAYYGGPNGTYYIKADGGGLNQIHITTNNSTAGLYGQVTVVNSTSNSNSGVFYITTTGGRGFNDDIIVLLSVKGPIPDNFSVNIISSGYTWTLVTAGTYNPPRPTNYTYNPVALNETFTKEDFLYGEQTTRPSPGGWQPLYNGQNTGDSSTAEYLMFIDLNVGNIDTRTLIDAGSIKVQYTFNNLNTTASFNAYAWAVASNQNEGINWGNPTIGGNPNCGYTVNYIPTVTPVANFTATPTNGTSPLTVHFSDTSSNIPTSWAWDFNNDGVIDSILQNPVWTYSTPGTYTVVLTAANTSGNNSLTQTDYITVNWPTPIANFTTNTTNGINPLTVQFNDTSTGNITNWNWDFNNDGIIDSTEQNPTWTYNTPGTYSITETVTGPGGNNNMTKTDYVTVNPADTTAPTVTTVDPANNAVNIATDKVITVTFNEAIKAGNLNIQLKTSNGTLIPTTKSINGNTLTITPTSPLTEARYMLLIYAGSVTDLAGNPIAAKTTSFSVGTSPTVTSTDPANYAMNVPTNKIITVTFNEPIAAKYLTLVQLKTTTGLLIPTTKTVSGNTLSITPTNPLATGTRYLLMIYTYAVTDLSGNPNTNKAISFTTGTT
jgi:large repetitive protein